MAKMIRCPDGHVYDSETHPYCPNCPPPEPVQAVAVTPTSAAVAPAPVTAARPPASVPVSWLLAGLVVIGASYGTYRFMTRPAPVTDTRTASNTASNTGTNTASNAASNSASNSVATNRAASTAKNDAKNDGKNDGKTAYHAPTDQDLMAPGDPAAPPPQPAVPDTSISSNSGISTNPSSPPQQMSPIQPVQPSQQANTPAAPSSSGTNYADETTDWGVPVQVTLQNNVGSRTPLDLPGTTRITTRDLPQVAARSALIDVLDDDSGNHQTIPGAIFVPGGGNYGRGSFNDTVQRGLTNVLAHITNRDPDYPLVFFCEGAQCWESYNACLRALNMGYRNVTWYRGGLQSWTAANLPLQPPVSTSRVR